MFDLGMIPGDGATATASENYSRHLSGRAPGEPPPTLLDYFPKDYLPGGGRVPRRRFPQIGRHCTTGDKARKNHARGIRFPPAVGAG